MDVQELNEVDEITMRLVHYLVTKEDYQPVIVNGVDNEVWLENTSKKYEVIRISNNYIHNDEQMDFDFFKTKTIVKQINKKTLSFKSKALSVLLNVGENVKNIKSDKNIDVCSLNNVEEMFNNDLINSIFPELKDDEVEANSNLEFLMNVTFDINKKNEEKSQMYEKTFSKKTILVTYALIAINILIFVLNNILHLDFISSSKFYCEASVIKAGEYYRLLTAAFFHVDIIHLLCNMYALYILGTQIETYLGKVKFLIVYILSALGGSLLSAVINGVGVPSIGASGAIFGLMGALLYFGFKYRNYLGRYVKEQLIPIIALNLILGFTSSSIDNFGHIGGLVTGIFVAMAVGVGKDNDEKINGYITTIIYFGFLIFMLFFR